MEHTKNEINKILHKWGFPTETPLNWKKNMEAKSIEISDEQYENRQKAYEKLRRYLNNKIAKVLGTAETIKSGEARTFTAMQTIQLFTEQSFQHFILKHLSDMDEKITIQAQTFDEASEQIKKLVSNKWETARKYEQYANMLRYTLTTVHEQQMKRSKEFAKKAAQSEEQFNQRQMEAAADHDELVQQIMNEQGIESYEAEVHLAEKANQDIIEYEASRTNEERVAEIEAYEQERQKLEHEQAIALAAEQEANAELVVQKWLAHDQMV